MEITLTRDATAGTLPDTVGANLLDTAQEAFTQGLQVAALTSAAVALAAAAVVGILLRRLGISSETKEAREPGRDGAAEMVRS